MSDKPIVDLRAINFPLLVDGYVQYDKKTGKLLIDRYEIQFRREGEDTWSPIPFFMEANGLEDNDKS
jgi:hypothetical protein